jgi:hypothetical protein
VQCGRIDRSVLIPPREEIQLWPGQPPVGSKNDKQLCRQHHVPVLGTFALADQDHTARAVDIRDHQSRHLRGPQAGRIGRGQRRPTLEAGDRFEKPEDLIGAENDRQLARGPCVGSAFRDRRLAQRDAIEKPQGADGLVKRAPGDTLRDEMNLEVADIVQTERVRRLPKVAA